MKTVLSTLLIGLMATASVSAQSTKSVTDLPDISVIGNFVGHHSDKANGYDVNEIEFSFQHYLYPGVKADIFTALHKEESGVMNFELEEAYITFSDLFDVIFPDGNTNFGIGAITGKKLLGVGKLNPLHPEQWAFVDRPQAAQQFFGEEHGLSGEGIQVMSLLPTPFFSQLELGYWRAAPHAEEGEEEHGGIEYENAMITGRLWNSFSSSDTEEVELGFSYLLGNSGAAETSDKPEVLGLDFTYTKELGADKAFKLQSELYQAKYGEEGEDRESQSGMYVSGVYQLNKHYEAGLRYDTLGKHGDEGKESNQLALILTRKLTDTSKFRLQYNSGEEIENTLYAQFIFGMGPHAHVLQ